jgi:hypothetical protein
MTRASRGRAAAALLAACLVTAACGGATDPTPQPTTVSDVVEDAAQQPNTGFGGAVDRAKDVAGDLDARNDALDN